MSLKSDVREAARDAHDLSVRLARIASQLPDPTEAKITDALQSDRRKVARDRDGKKLRVGDLVLVTDSERYGTTEAVVRGPGDDLGDGKKRVHLALLDGRNDDYQASAGRVKRLGRPSVRSGGTGYARASADFARTSGPVTFPNAGFGDPIIIAFGIGDAGVPEPNEPEGNGGTFPNAAEFSVRRDLRTAD